MRRMKKLLAVMLAAIMVMSMCSMSVMAATATGDKTITITGASSGRTYYAYQIFSGTYSNGALTDIGTGSGLNVTSDNTAAIEAITSTLTSSEASVNIEFNGTTYTKLGEFVTDYMKVYANESVSWIANLLSTYGGDNPNMVIAFAEVTAQFLTDDYYTADYQTSSGNYVFSNLPDGYYLIVEQTTTTASGSSYSRYMLTNAVDSSSSSTIAAKSVTPTLDKTIVLTESSTETESTTSSIGDAVTYKLTSAVPDMTGYSKYTYIITDEISSGLTLVVKTDTTNVSSTAQSYGLTELDLAITVGGTMVSGMRVYDADDASAASSRAYYYYTTEDNTTGDVTLTIVFNNLMGYTTGDAIVVTYTAELNDGAVIGDGGNDNTAYLTYSNNPNLVPETIDTEVEITSEVTSETEVEGVTTEIVTTEVTTEITTEVTTYEPSTETGNTVEEKAVVYTYELDLTKVDNVSTTTTLSGAEFSLYKEVDGTTYYAIVEEDTQNTDGYYTVTDWTATKADGSTLVSGAKGELYIKGLGAGTYSLEETKAPTGYTVWSDPMTIEISAETGATSTTKLEATVDGTEATTVASAGTISASVTNSSSSELPTTGGMGTTMFYLAGVILVLGASVILVTRRRFER